MKDFNFKTSGVCAQNINFSIDDEKKLHNVKFSGGCPGNTSALSKVLEGMDAEKVVSILKGNQCRDKGTSCADQLAVAIEKEL